MFWVVLGTCKFNYLFNYFSKYIMFNIAVAIDNDLYAK